MIAPLRCRPLLAAFVSLALLAGCGEPAQEETAPEPRSPALVIEERPSAAGPRSAPVVSSELPADFPSDVPQHPAARVVQARASADRGMSVSMSVDGDADEVASFYADTFASQGWSTDIRRTPDGQAIFADKSGRAASAIVRRADEKTLVDIIIVQLPAPPGS